jgi:Tol biopolymer transport system component
MRKQGFIVLAMVGALVGAFGADTIAGKGGGGKKPPPEPPADPAIAYRAMVYKGRSASSQLVIMNADGSNKTVVLDAGAGGPTWSPDGLELAFKSDVQGRGLYVIGRDGTGLSKVLDLAAVPRLAAGSPAWSPVLEDGSTWLAFTSDVEGPDGSYDVADLFVVRLDGTGLLNVSSTPGVKEWLPTWSPDGRRIAVDAGSHNTGYDIITYDLELVGGALTVTGSTNLTGSGSPLDTELVQMPGWSKAGSSVAVQVNYQSIWVIDADDPASVSEMLPASVLSADLQWPTWSPDDSQIAFRVAGRSGLKLGIYVMNVDGTDLQLIAPSSDKYGVHAPNWRRNP